MKHCHDTVRREVLLAVGSCYKNYGGRVHGEVGKGIEMCMPMVVTLWDGWMTWGLAKVWDAVVSVRGLLERFLGLKEEDDGDGKDEEDMVAVK